MTDELMTEQDAALIEQMGTNGAMNEDESARILATYHAHARLVAELKDWKRLKRDCDERNDYLNTLANDLRAQLAEAQEKNEVKERQIADLIGQLEEAQKYAARLEVWHYTVMDGNAVYAALPFSATKHLTARDVSDVLDAVAVAVRTRTERKEGE